MWRRLLAVRRNAQARPYPVPTPLRYAVHLAAARDGIELTLAHLPWTKLHNFDAHVSPIAGPPAAESVALHYLKVNPNPKVSP